MKRLLFTLVGLLSMVAIQAQSGYGIGDAVADFTLTNVDGEEISLNSYLEESEGVIVVFTCNTCPFAVKYEDRIKELAATYNDSGWPVVAIQPNDPGRSPGDSFEKMVSLASDHGYQFPYLYDDSQEIAAAFGATRTPHTYLLQAVDGEFVVQYIGAIDDNPNSAEAVEVKYVEDAIEALKAGEEVERPSTRAIGCTIKWAS